MKCSVLLVSYNTIRGLTVIAELLIISRHLMSRLAEWPLPKVYKMLGCTCRLRYFCNPSPACYISQSINSENKWQDICTFAYWKWKMRYKQKSKSINEHLIMCTIAPCSLVWHCGVSCQLLSLSSNMLCDNVRCRWDNDEVEKLSPWDLEPLEDCSMLNLPVLPFNF